MKRLLRTLVLLLVRIIGAPRSRRSARKQHPVLIRPDHLGDLVMTTPILETLRNHIPDAHITMMTGSWSSMVVERHPAINELITCPFPGFRRVTQKPLAPYTLLFSTARQLRRGNYDLAINLRPDFWWGAALIYLAGIPRRVGYAIKPGTTFLTHALSFPQPEHATVSNLRLASAGLEALGHIALEEPFTPQRFPLAFVPSPEEREWVKERLCQEGIDEQTPLIIIHPGSGAAVKLWRAEAWTSIANTLATSQRFAQTPRIVLTGSPAERPLLDEIARDMQGNPVICAQQSVGQLAALLQRAQLVLGVDSGPLHLAIAQDTPSLQIFGPTDTRIFGPWGNPERHVILTSTRRCPGCPAIPCGRLDFTEEELATHPCVRQVGERQVIEIIDQLLERQLPGRSAKGHPISP
ncbi:MAG: glycosyltransferase family 9 protein [Ktedonobacteraceae bacterium]|nr:glycosyltransferase family 9 protein [Ktedonobacteraceae bacterium]